LTALLGAARAAADPIFPEPVVGKAHWGDDSDPGEIGLLVDMRALGVLAADRLASFPARRYGLEDQVPALIAAHAGARAVFRDLPLILVARADIAEAARPYHDSHVGAVVDGVLDDLYLEWTAARPFHLIVGRARVPWSKPRQYEELDEPLGSPAFIVDRIAPDRRWGAVVIGDLGAASYAAGAWEDFDALEPRVRVGDPSSGGAFATGAWIEWTPRAPMYGGNPVGAIVGARGPLPTPRTDPCFDTWRISVGAGALARLREDGSTRFDLAMSALTKWGPVSAQAEIFIARDGGRQQLGGDAELMVTPIDHIAVSVRGEFDDGAPNGGERSAAAAIQYHVTKDRRNRVGIVGWRRRDVSRNTPYDALAVFLQASL
jgi:hypothetical protein